MGSVVENVTVTCCLNYTTTTGRLCKYGISSSILYVHCVIYT